MSDKLICPFWILNLPTIFYSLEVVNDSIINHHLMIFIPHGG